MDNIIKLKNLVNVLSHCRCTKALIGIKDYMLLTDEQKEYFIPSDKISGVVIFDGEFVPKNMVISIDDVLDIYSKLQSIKCEYFAFKVNDHIIELRNTDGTVAIINIDNK